MEEQQKKEEEQEEVEEAVIAWRCGSSQEKTDTRGKRERTAKGRVQKAGIKNGYAKIIGRGKECERVTARRMKAP